MAYYVGLGEKVARFAEGWIVQTKGRWAGEALRLEPWQRELLDELFLVDEAGRLVYREALIGVARKNGKSTLAAAVALYGLLASGENSPEVYVAASSKEQARIVFDQARDFVEASPKLRDWLRPQRNVITCRANNGVFRVLSSDAPRQHGLNPSLVVIDELHAHDDPELYYALTTGQLARENPLVLSITTAGYDEESICYQVYQLGRRLERGGLEAMRKQRFYFRWFAADPDADIDDEAQWRKANPSSWVSLDDLRIERGRLPVHVFRRLHLNQWTPSEEAWLPVGAWERCARPGIEIPEGATNVSVGVDLGLKHDNAAVVAAWPRPDGKVVVQAKIVVPPPREALDIGIVEDIIRGFARRWRVRNVLYDPWLFTRSAQMLEAEGLPMLEHPMKTERTAPASQSLYEAIVDGTILHPDQADFNAHVAAGTTVMTERGFKIAKRKARNPNDALTAMLLAFVGTGLPSEAPDVTAFRIQQL